MEKLKIKIHPTFIIFGCLLVYFGQGFLFLNYLCVIFLHELAHAFVARKLGYNIKNIKLIPFGICLNINSSEIMTEDEIKIALAGPICNLILSLFCFAIWWLFPASYNYTYLFCYANLITCLFNLLPAFPLDGGRILRGIIRSKSNKDISSKICKIVNIVLCVLLLVLFILSCFVRVNITYLFVIFCLLTGIFDKNEQDKYTFIQFSTVKKSKKIVKLKNLYISEDEMLYKVCRHIDSFSYLNLYIFDKDEHLKIILSEQEYLGLIEKSSATNTFKEALNSNKGTF